MMNDSDSCVYGRRSLLGFKLFYLLRLSLAISFESSAPIANGENTTPSELLTQRQELSTHTRHIHRSVHNTSDTHTDTL